MSSLQNIVKGEWSKYTAQQRSDVMNKFADLVDKHAADLGRWESKCMGQPFTVTQWIYGIVSQTFRYYAGWTNKMPGEQWPEEDGIYKVQQSLCSKSFSQETILTISRLFHTIPSESALESVRGMALASSSHSKLPPRSPQDAP